MDLSPNINNLEKDKFAADADLGTVVKALVKIFGGQLTVLAPSDFVPSIITVTAVGIEYVRQPNSVAVDIINLNEVDEVYMGPNSSMDTDMTTAGLNKGKRIGPEEGNNFSLEASKNIWFKTKPGKTVLVHIVDWIRTT